MLIDSLYHNNINNYFNSYLIVLLDDVKNRIKLYRFRRIKMTCMCFI